jgi:protein phosphatase 2C family protein 2/3
MFATTDLLVRIDPKYEEEVSGCTASVGVISRDKIWVVSFTPDCL